ncbi:DNA-binding protein, partial [Candidatus Acetothermia bacterium]
MIMKGIGDRLRAARREKGLTLEELSGRCGLSPGFLSQVERGRSTLSIVSLSAICHALDLPIASLFSASGPLDRKAPRVRREADQLHIRIGGSPISYRYLTGQLPASPIAELL